MMGCIASNHHQPHQELTIEQHSVHTRGPMTILYGTTAGTSSRLAFEFSKEAREHLFSPRVVNLGEFNENLITTSKLIVLFVASYGQGGPTSDSEAFFQWMFSEQRQKDNLKNTKYLVFGLGNKSYENFCGMGVKTDQRLEELGAQRIFELGKVQNNIQIQQGDSLNETTEQDYFEWKKKGVWEALISNFPVMSMDLSKINSNDCQFLVNQDNEMRSIDLSQVKDTEKYDFVFKQYQTSLILPVIEMRELKKNFSDDNSTLFISLDFTEARKQGVDYQTAGNILIYPENDPVDVYELCNFLGWNPNSAFQIEQNPEINYPIKLPIPSPILLREYLMKYKKNNIQKYRFCDFTGPVSKLQLYELSTMVQNKAFKQELELLSSFQGREKFDEEITNKRQSLFTLLQKYNIKNISLQKWVNLVQPLRPRTYTIASSSKKYPNEIHIIVSSLKMNVGHNEKFGVATKFFKNNYQLHKYFKSQIFLRAILKESSFKFPSDPQIPVLLVGPGAGLAPMLGFIQERDYYLEKDQLSQSPFQGSMSLYFGCRTKDEYLLQDELEEYANNGTLTQLHVAFSREQDKIHVTHLLGKDLQALSQHFFDFHGVMYVCGSVQMGQDILNVVGNMFKQIKKVMPYAAFKKVQELEQKGQIIKEIWG